MFWLPLKMKLKTVKTTRCYLECCTMSKFKRCRLLMTRLMQKLVLNILVITKFQEDNRKQAT